MRLDKKKIEIKETMDERYIEIPVSDSCVTIKIYAQRSKFQQHDDNVRSAQIKQLRKIAERLTI